MEFLDKKRSYLLIFVSWLAYTSAYIGRLNYNASIVEITAVFGATKAEAGLVGSFFFFAYGIGQLVNGFLSGKCNSRVMISASLLISSALNVSMAFLPSLSAMKYLWLANGAVQSVLWTNIIKLQSKYLNAKYFNKAVFVMSTTVAIGTFAAYGLSALFVHLGNWKAVFYAACGILAAASVLCFCGIAAAERSPKAAEPAPCPPPLPVLEEKKRHTGKAGFWAAVAVVCFTSVVNGFIKEGVTVWVPNVLYEVFRLDKALSILLTLLLPLLSIFGASLVVFVHRRIKGHILMNSLFYACAAAFLLIIVLTLPKLLLIPVLICFVGTVCAMAAVNNVVTSLFPLEFRGTCASGLLAGVINAFCYAGSTLSTYGLGRVADASGWNDVFLLLLIASAAAAAIGAVFELARGLCRRRGNKN